MNWHVQRDDMDRTLESRGHMEADKEELLPLVVYTQV